MTTTPLSSAMETRAPEILAGRHVVIGAGMTGHRFASQLAAQDPDDLDYDRHRR